MIGSLQNRKDEEEAYEQHYDGWNYEVLFLVHLARESFQETLIYPFPEKILFNFRS